MTKETGTLAELNVKPGDVVELVGWLDDADRDSLVGEQYTIMTKHPKGYCGDLCAVRDGGGWERVNHAAPIMLFRIVSRAADTPKTWGEMTDEEKGALLLAHHEGKVIEVFSHGEWGKVLNMIWYDWNAYRVAPPEPKRETVPLYGCGWEWGQASKPCDEDTHRITFDLIDGKPDCASIRMEEL